MVDCGGRGPELGGKYFFNIKLVLADQKCYEEVVISTSLFFGRLPCRIGAPVVLKFVPINSVLIRQVFSSGK